MLQIVASLTIIIYDHNSFIIQTTERCDEGRKLIKTGTSSLPLEALLPLRSPGRPFFMSWLMAETETEMRQGRPGRHDARRNDSDYHG